jgi:hypothetical protein
MLRREQRSEQSSDPRMGGPREAPEIRRGEKRGQQRDESSGHARTYHRRGVGVAWHAHDGMACTHDGMACTQDGATARRRDAWDRCAEAVSCVLCSACVLIRAGQVKSSQVNVLVRVVW